MFLIDFFGYSLPAVKTTDILVFIAFLLVIIMFTVWFRFGSEGFKKFVYRTFTDAAGVPDAKLLTAFIFTLIQTFLTVRGSLFERWPPEALYDSNLLFIGTLLGLDVTNTIFRRKDGTKTNP